MSDLDLPKILIIYAHPDPHASVANRQLLSGVEHLSHVRVHDLYSHYPDFFIDVQYEQDLLCQYQVIVFQHPLYMYSCPALLKEWIDVVLCKGFAHGNGVATKGKLWRSVVTAGGSPEAYTQQGYNHSSLDQILVPFRLSAELCQMEWQRPLVLYWARRIDDEARAQHVRLYHEWLLNPYRGMERTDGE